MIRANPLQGQVSMRPGLTRHWRDFPNMNKRTIIVLFALGIACFLLACGSPEQKRDKFFKKGVSLYEQGDYIKARLEFKNALQIDLKYAKAWHMLGMVEFRAGKSKEAFKALSKAVDLDPTLLNAQLTLAKLYLSIKNTAKAMEKISLVLNEQPDDPAALLVKSAVLLAEKDDESAKSILHALLKKGLTQPDVYIMLAAAYTNENKPEIVKKVLHDGIAANPNSIVLKRLLADTLIVLGDLKGATRQYEEIIAIQPDNIDSQLKFAEFCLTSNQPDKAEVILNRIAEADPGHVGKRIAIARLYFNNNLMEKAGEELHDALSHNPGSFKLRFALSEYLTNDSTSITARSATTSIT